jgi:hypothetical protein
MSRHDFFAFMIIWRHYSLYSYWIFTNNSTNMASPSTPMEIGDTDDLSVLNSDSLPTLDGEESNKIRALLVAEDDVAHDRAWHELPHEHRLKIKGIDYALCEPYRPKNAVKRAWIWEQGIELIRVTKGRSVVCFLIITNVYRY